MPFHIPSVDLEDQTEGKLVSQGSNDFAVVAVSGQSPPADHKFAVSLRGGTLGRVEPKSGAINGGPVDFSELHVKAAMTDSSAPTSASTTGALAVGEMGLQGANIWMIVDVYDANGDAIGAGEGNIWAWRVNGGDTVQAVSDSLAVTKLDATYDYIVGA